jgi:istB-like protein
MELNNNKTAPIVQEMDKNQLSLDLMHRMRLTGMATVFEESLTTTIADTMTPDAFLSWLLSREWDYRSAAAIERLIKSAGFRYKAYPEQIDYNINRNLSKTKWREYSHLILSSKDAIYLLLVHQELVKVLSLQL